MEINDDQIAMMLQASRDFAFQQLAQAGGFIPFATRARQDGEMEFVRFADESTEDSIEEIYRRTQLMLAEQAQQGEILAAATVANVEMPESGDESGFYKAIRVHLEGPNYSRMILAPYRVDTNVAEGELPALEAGDMIPMAAEPAIFAG